MKELRKYLKSKGRNSGHAFSNYEPDEWLFAFKRLSSHNVSMKIVGGEPFFDRKKFYIVLKGLTESENIKYIRIDTNGSWDPKYFSKIKKERIFLNMSFHPEMISMERFINVVSQKLDCGFNVGMVNYVMSPTQYNSFEEIRERLFRMGVHTNPNIYIGPGMDMPEILKEYRKYLPELDILYKTEKMSPYRKLCYYPSCSYEIDPSGILNRGCIDGITNFFKEEFPTRSTKPMPCPKKNCGCLDMYAFNEDFAGRGASYNLLIEYVKKCKEFIRKEDK